MTNRVILGKNSANVFVARVSAPGYDVLTITDLSRFQLHESYAAASMLISGKVSSVNGAAAISVLFTNLGFVPACKIYSDFAEADAGRYPLGPTSIEVRQDRLIFPANGTGFDLNFYYQVFAVPQS